MTEEQSVVEFLPSVKKDSRRFKVAVSSSQPVLDQSFHVHLIIYYRSAEGKARLTYHGAYLHNGASDSGKIDKTF